MPQKRQPKNDSERQQACYAPWPRDALDSWVVVLASGTSRYVLRVGLGKGSLHESASGGCRLSQGVLFYGQTQYRGHNRQHDASPPH